MKTGIKRLKNAEITRPFFKALFWDMCSNVSHQNPFLFASFHCATREYSKTKCSNVTFKEWIKV